jgi:hypothetical protein
MEHHIAGVAGMWGTDFGRNLAPESRVSFRFDEPGTYPYSCYIHLGMSGVIVVGDGSFVGQTGTSQGVQTVSQAVSAAAAAQRQAPADSAPAVLAAATPTETASTGANGLVMALLGGLIGGVAVAVAFGAKSIRRG